MKKEQNRPAQDELRPEYDLPKLKGPVRGKYAKRMMAGASLVILSPDVAEYFADDESVNTALRALIGIAKAKPGLPH